jgi:hypothetical protein
MYNEDDPTRYKNERAEWVIKKGCRKKRKKQAKGGKRRGI